jgi:poly [ADP-ribose] polymerase
MQAKMREALKNGYKQIEIAADVGLGVVNKEVTSKIDIRKKAVQEIAGDDKQLNALVTMLVDRNTREITSNTTLKIDSSTGLFKTDAGVIVTAKVVDEARGILTNLKTIAANRAGCLKKHDSLTCEYLMRIPTNIGRARPTFENVFPDQRSIDKQDQILDALVGSLDILSKPQTDKDAPVKEEKRIWSLTMKPVEDYEFDRVNRVFKSTYQQIHACARAGLKLSRVWNLSIHAMDEAFDKDGKNVGSVQELWHGTRVGNLLSIFARGLIIPPWCDSGSMFGRSLYFSDQSTKSLNYAYGYWSGSGYDNTCYMLLNDVAMGKPYVPRGPHNFIKAPDGFDSVFAKAGQSGVMNNEMMIYRPSQCKVKRLCEFST